MGRKSRYISYAKCMNKSGGHNMKITGRKDSIKNRINAMKEKSRKGVK